MSEHSLCPDPQGNSGAGLLEQACGLREGVWGEGCVCVCVCVCVLGVDLYFSDKTAPSDKGNSLRREEASESITAGRETHSLV